MSENQHTKCIVITAYIDTLIVATLGIELRWSAIAGRPDLDPESAPATTTTTKPYGFCYTGMLIELYTKHKKSLILSTIDWRKLCMLGEYIIYTNRYYIAQPSSSWALGYSRLIRALTRSPAALLTNVSMFSTTCETLSHKTPLHSRLINAKL